MTNALFDRLKISFGLMSEVIGHIPESKLSSKLADLPSNTIGQQLWCVVGARESYTRGIQKGQWDGFRCSLAFELLEHEVQLQGQLIRYLYGLKLGIPSGLKTRYHLD